MRIRASVTAGVLVLGALAARAEVVQTDGISASLELPAGYCAMTRAHPVDRQIYEMQDRMQAASNGVMLFAVSCDEIEGARKGQPLKKWALWLINGPVGKHLKIPPAMSREAITQSLLKQMPSLDVDQISKDTSGSAAKEGIALALKEMRIIADDKTVMYTGQVANLEKGAVKRQIAVVTGWAAMSGRLFTLNLYTDLDGAKTFDALLVQAREAIARSISTSDGLAPPQ